MTKYNLKYVLPLVIAFFTACNNNKKMDDVKQNALVFPKGEKITNENFTGTAYLQMLMDADSLNSNSVGNVTFEPGARSNWHLHPAGQILLVTDGVGYYQEKGQRSEEHTSELQSLMRISYAVFCLKKKTKNKPSKKHI